jgi:UDP-N-acetylmuramate dehydrogenase
VTGSAASDWRAGLQRLAAGRDLTVKLNEPLAGHTTFGIGGPAEVWAIAESREALAAVVGFCRERAVELRLLGRGSNVLVSDQGLRGVVLRLAGEMAKVECRNDGGVCRIAAGAGALLDEVVDAAEEHGLAGAEFLAGIPGTVGGALHSNAGAYGRSLADVIESVTVMDRAGGERVLGRPLLRNEYRSPVVHEELIVTGVELGLERGRPAPARELRKQRWVKHPKEPSAGSYFRNPRHEPAGRHIDRCGLKGTSVGGARVSEQHANFIVNTGNASFRQVYELAEIVKASVEAQTGFELVEEVRVLPEGGAESLDRR